MWKLCSFSLAVAVLFVPEASTAAPRFPENVSVQRAISYGPHKETVLDVYLPRQLDKKRRVGVIAIHGGEWIHGSRESVVDLLVLPFLEKGCVVANIDYRVAPENPAPAAVEDAVAAVKWFRENADKYNVDTDRIVLVGKSSGGHLALMAGMATKAAGLGKMKKVAAIINFNGSTDVEDQLQGVNMQEYAVKWVGEGKEKFELARKLSPMTYLREDVPPIMTIHGTADEKVPYEHGVSMTKALRDMGADAEMVAVANGEHEFTEDQLQNWIYPQIFYFLHRREILK